MAFGDETTLTECKSASPDSINDLLQRNSRTPSLLRQPIIRGGGDSKELTDKEDPNGEGTEGDDDIEEDEQSFGDHDDVCRRLERTLGLNFLGEDGRSVDDWTELASVIGYHYAKQMNPAWVRSAGKQNISPSALLLCLIYMERLHATNPDFRYRHLMASSDMFVVSLMSACKFLYDVGETGDCYNGTWARHCKIPIKRLNRMEVDFLSALDWNLQSEAAEFESVMDKVQTDIVRSNLRFHTSMTYADLLALSNGTNGFSQQMVLESIASVVKIFATLTVSYVLFGVLTLSIGAPLALGLSARASPSASTTSPASTTPSLPAVTRTAVTICSTAPASSTAVLMCNDSAESLTTNPVHLPKGPYRDLVARYPKQSVAGLSLTPLQALTRMGMGGPPNMAHFHYVVF